MIVVGISKRKVTASVRLVLRLWWVGVLVLVSLFFFSYFGTDDIISSPVEASSEISGTTSFSVNLESKELKARSETKHIYTAYVGTNGYLLQMKDTNTNLLSEVYSNGSDTLYIDRIPSGAWKESDKNGKLLKSGALFKATISPTPYPFGAPEELQVVWLSICASSNLIQSISTNHPPGIVFSKVFKSPLDYDWYHFQLREIKADDRGHLVSFEQWSMDSSLISSNSLIERGLKPEEIKKYYTISTNDPGKLVLRNEKVPTNGYIRYFFNTLGKYQNTQYPSNAVLTGFARPVSGVKDDVRDMLSMQVTDVKKVSMEILPPAIPKITEVIIPLHLENLLKDQKNICIEVSDYRKNKINTTPVKYYLYEPKEWPFSSNAKLKR